MMVWLEVPPERKPKGLSDFIRNSLKDLGFLIAEEKCEWEPKTKVVWLDLVWDFGHGIMHITEKGTKNLIYSIDQLLSGLDAPLALVTARSLAGILGQIVSMHTVVGSLVQLKQGKHSNVSIAEQVGMPA